ncbi:MAG: Smr/MutS family protein [bacterium]|nr:Smr/MutS family protein [bacterium]
MQICEVCGNSFDAAVAGPGRCPYCHSKQSSSGHSVAPSSLNQHRLINLEKGMPLVDQAIKRLETEIRASRLQGIRVLSLIHGYGSSGRGGAIREAVRARLAFLEQQQVVESAIPGEEFEGRSSRGKQLLRRYPFLRRHPDLNRANPGVTVVLLAGKPVKERLAANVE